MTVNQHNIQAFKMKGRFYTFTVLQLLSSDLDLFSRQLKDTIQQAPKLFENAPVVLDFSAIAAAEVDLGALCQLIREQAVIPVAIQGADAFVDVLAQSQGLAVLKSSATQDREIACEAEETPPKEIPFQPAKYLSTPVRSGQQVVAQGSDLVISASVSHGAELLADGNIHVYGALRGRALAGISGNSEARIFCQSLDAELLSIAGYYRLSDNIEPLDKPCQVYLQDEQIHIQPL